MTFGEKLKALRKEKGYSQEEFAELFEVSRQAVSKWESDRGIPETSKLVQISTLFGVSLDYLLKDEAPQEEARSSGYYVSRETLDGFLSYRRQRAKRIALGVGLLIVSDVFGCFPAYRQAFLLPYWGTAALGVGILLWVLFQAKQYREIGTQELLFDPAVLRDFQEECVRDRKRHAWMIVIGAVLFLFGTEFLSLAEGMLGSSVRNALEWMVSAAAAMLVIIAGLGLRAEAVLLRNKL